MPRTAPTLCFQCGQSADARHRLNRLADGRPCPACADRLLECMPPLLPGFRLRLEAPDELESAVAADLAEHGGDVPA